MTAAELRVCSWCGLGKPQDAFYKNKLGKGGRDNACKDCRRARGKAQYEARTEAEKTAETKRAAAWRQANAEKVKAAQEAYRTAHRERLNEQRRAAYAVTPEDAKRHRQLKSKYGMNLDDYARLWARQGRHCALCPTVLFLGGAVAVRPNIDHDHQTGDVRGILCNRCNLRIGFLENRGVDGLLQDLEYLESPPAKDVLAGSRKGAA